MRQLLFYFLSKIRTIYKTILTLPGRLRYPIAGILIILGGINIVNPLINGVLLILAGVGLISGGGYRYIKKLRDKHKTHYKKTRDSTISKQPPQHVA